jgi:hypothetical protein
VLEFDDDDDDGGAMSAFDSFLADEVGEAVDSGTLDVVMGLEEVESGLDVALSGLEEVPAFELDLGGGNMALPVTLLPAPLERDLQQGDVELLLQNAVAAANVENPIHRKKELKDCLDFVEV